MKEKTKTSLRKIIDKILELNDLRQFNEWIEGDDEIKASFKEEGLLSLVSDPNSGEGNKQKSIIKIAFSRSDLDNERKNDRRNKISDTKGRGFIFLLKNDKAVYLGFGVLYYGGSDFRKGGLKENIREECKKLYDELPPKGFFYNNDELEKDANGRGKNVSGAGARIAVSAVFNKNYATSDEKIQEELIKDFDTVLEYYEQFKKKDYDDYFEKKLEEIKREQSGKKESIKEYTLTITKDSLTTNPLDPKFDATAVDYGYGQATTFGLKSKGKPIRDIRYESNGKTITCDDHDLRTGTGKVHNSALVRLCIGVFEDKIDALSEAERKVFPVVKKGLQGLYNSEEEWRKAGPTGKGWGFHDFNKKYYYSGYYVFTNIAFAQECLKRWDPDGKFEIVYQVVEGGTNETSRIFGSTGDVSSIKYKKEIIYAGPPGTGKTRKAKITACQIVSEEYAEELYKYICGEKSIGELSEEVKRLTECIKLVQMHPSYSYYDFMESLEVQDGSFKVSDKPFKMFAVRAKNDPDNNYVLIIDEINRANIADVFGELLYGLEYRDTEFNTELKPKEPFAVPKNLYVIGTMNTADRSLQNIDYAIRRRFAFERVLSRALAEAEVPAGKIFCNKVYEKVREDVLSAVSRGVQAEDIMPGISFFLVNKKYAKPDYEHLEYKLKYELIPLLKEYAKDGLLSPRRNGELIEMLRKQDDYFDNLMDIQKAEPEEE